MLTDHMLDTPEAKKAYSNSTLFNRIYDVMKAAEIRHLEIPGSEGADLGYLLAQVCEAREDWLTEAVSRFARLPDAMVLAPTKYAVWRDEAGGSKGGVHGPFDSLDEALLCRGEGPDDYVVSFYNRLAPGDLSVRKLYRWVNNSWTTKLNR